MAIIAIFHTSDFHIGSKVNPQFGSIAGVPKIRLKNPHSLTLARGLQEAMQTVPVDLSVSRAWIRNVMSGDATATGSEQELYNAHTFIQSNWCCACPSKVHVGLGFDVLSADLLKVSGNHDQWRGFPYPGRSGFNPHLRGVHFDDTPWHSPWDLGGWTINIFGIDSSSGQSAKLPTTKQEACLDLNSGGELDKLRQQLRAVQSNPQQKPHVNVLVMHHSLASATFDPASRYKLLELIEDFRIRAVLTGHTHDFFQKQLRSAKTKQLLEAYEIRSSSALQGPDDRTWPEPAGFLVHRIEPLPTTSQIKWDAFRYQWDFNLQQFVRHDTAISSFFFTAIIDQS